jgi:selenide, water dikinase
MPAVSFEIDYQAVPLLSGALEAARAGMLPGGLKNNRQFLGDCVGFQANVPEEFRALLSDPQTSGGLLVAVPADAAATALELFEQHAVPAARIGFVKPKQLPLLHVS